MAMSGGKDDGSPMMDMNTTPLIDVMLVLLIMFIITIPVATHSVNIDLPGPPPPNLEKKIDPIKNKVTISVDNKVMWNSTVVNNNDLLAMLHQTTNKTAFPTEPELQFQPDQLASYELSARVLNIIKGSGVTKFGFVGNENYAVFGKAAGAPPAKAQ